MSKKTRQQQKKAQEIQKAATVPGASKPQVGLLVTDELQKALDYCRILVERIAKDSRAKNRKFRDIEFDLDNDKHLCLYGLVANDEHSPTNVARVTDIFPYPKFFIDGAGSNDIVQGRLGDCWFLSALSTISASNGLIEKFCVSRDEQVGVYGFVFFKNGSWTSVIIDDLLYVHIPKFEELAYAEQLLFHSDKVTYNKTTRKGGKGLYFARSGTENETWVPLIEKAYAKLHGDYSALSGGRSAEAIEDLTGGVSSMIRINDILDTCKFWEEELLKTNVDRLFGAAFNELNTERSGKGFIEVEGLIGGHAYSILKAVEVGGKRFVILRNPWGSSEWKGPWSDGSREWTPEWLSRLPEIGHQFGEDGQFVMEYSNFLEQFEHIDKTLLFDDSWKMSMEWLNVPTRAPPSAWSFGDASFNFTIAEPTHTVIVLSKIDDRYFKGIEGPFNYNLQFLVYKVNGEESELVSESDQPVFGSRSVNTETLLEPGNYAVHIRLEGLFIGSPPDPSDFDQRKLARVLTERSQARLVASNYDPMTEVDNFPIPMSALIERETVLSEARAKAATNAASSTPNAEKEEVEEIAEDAGDEVNWVDEDEDEKKGKVKKSKKAKKDSIGNQKIIKEGEVDGENSDGADDEDEDDDKDDGDYTPSTVDEDSDTSSTDPESFSVYLGLRIYTQSSEQVPIIGNIRKEVERLYIASILSLPPDAITSDMNED